MERAVHEGLDSCHRERLGRVLVASTDSCRKDGEGNHLQSADHSTHHTRLVVQSVDLSRFTVLTGVTGQVEATGMPMDSFEEALKGHVSGIEQAFRRHEQTLLRQLRYVREYFVTDDKLTGTARSTSTLPLTGPITISRRRWKKCMASVQVTQVSWPPVLLH